MPRHQYAKQNGDVDGEVGDDAAANIDAVVFFLPARWGDTVKINHTVELFSIGKRYCQ